MSECDSEQVPWGSREKNFENIAIRTSNPCNSCGHKNHERWDCVTSMDVSSFVVRSELNWSVCRMRVLPHMRLHRRHILRCSTHLNVFQPAWNNVRMRIVDFVAHAAAENCVIQVSADCVDVVCRNSTLKFTPLHNAFTCMIGVCLSHPSWNTDRGV